ncbi:MAG: hypothetical protein AVDCRST_MAG91-2641, partial [uncultured Sphingomonadaceae bacterium]
AAADLLQPLHRALLGQFPVCPRGAVERAIVPDLSKDRPS